MDSKTEGKVLDRKRGETNPEKKYIIEALETGRGNYETNQANNRGKYEKK